MKVKFVPLNIEIEIDPDKSVLQLAHENGIPIRSICKGVPSCAECRVRILEGENHVLPPTKAEINLIGSTYFVDQRRLSCQLRCFGDVTLDIAPHLEKDESASKKLRGVKSSSLPRETKAVQGTMVLDEPAPPMSAAADRPSRGEGRPQVQGQGPRTDGKKRNNSKRRRPRRNNKGGPKKPSS